MGDVQSPDSPAAQLAASGRRLTTPRRAVLDALSRAGGPLTIEEIWEAVPDVGRATVFRTVKLLLELGLICRVVLENGSVRYVPATPDHHHHFICNACGAVEEFQPPPIDEAIRALADASGFELSGHALELYGRCRRCRETSG